MEELARQGILVRWREGYLPAQDVPLLQAQAFEPLRVRAGAAPERPAGPLWGKRTKGALQKARKRAAR